MIICTCHTASNLPIQTLVAKQWLRKYKLWRRKEWLESVSWRWSQSTHTHTYKQAFYLNFSRFLIRHGRMNHWKTIRFGTLLCILLNNLRISDWPMKENYDIMSLEWWRKNPNSYVHTTVKWPANDYTFDAMYVHTQQVQRGFFLFPQLSYEATPTVALIQHPRQTSHSLHVFGTTRERPTQTVMDRCAEATSRTLRLPSNTHQYKYQTYHAHTDSWQAGPCKNYMYKCDHIWENLQ